MSKRHQLGEALKRSGSMRRTQLLAVLPKDDNDETSGGDEIVIVTVVWERGEIFGCPQKTTVTW